MFTSFLEKLVKTLDSVDTVNELLIRLAISVGLIVLVFIFKNKLAQFISFILSKLFFKKSERGAKALKDSLTRPLSYFLCVVAVYGATEIFAPSGQIRHPIITIVKIGFILTTAWFGIRAVGSDYSFFIKDDSTQTQKTAVKFLSNILKCAIIIIAVLLMLEQFGISATKLFAALGLGGVAVAFACKDAVENMLSGFIIIFDKPFEVDDFVEIEGTAGTVEDIKIRTTRIRVLDGSEMIFPNTTVANVPVTNWTKIDKRSVCERYGLTYSMNNGQITQFCARLEDIIKSNESVNSDSVRISFDKYGDNGLEVEAFYYIDEADIVKYKSVLTDIHLCVKEYVDSSDIELAFTTQTIHIAKD